MADISQLGALNPVEPLDLDMYADAKPSGGFRLPPKGEYVVRAPETFPKEAFGRANSGALSAQVDPTIVGPTNEGFQIRFQKISAKQYQRNGKLVSQFGDYLRACGFRGKLANEQEQADAIEQTANRTYRVFGDWKAYHKDTQYSVKGMERFTSDGNGGYLPYVEHPTAKDENGKPLRLRANFEIVRFIPADEE